MRHRVHSLLLRCAVACLAVSPLAMASEYHGQVTFGGLPVPGTVVTATQGDKKVTAVTDAQGLYSFADLADGTWTIALSMTGFEPLKQDVTVPPVTPPAAIELKLFSLDAMRVAAKPVKVDPAALMAATAPPAPAATTSAPAGTPAKGAAAKGATPAKGAAAGTETASAAAPPPPPTPDPNAAQANDGFLINGSVNNAATSQYAQSQAFGNTRNGKSLYNYGMSLMVENSALNAQYYSLSGVSTPKQSFNNFTAGVTFGGPIKIPHLTLRNFRLDFAQYQRTQRSTNQTTSTLVPTLAQRYGDLTGAGVVHDPFKKGQIYGATNCSPLLASVDASPTACIPQDELATQDSLAAQALLTLYPMPNPKLKDNPRYNYQVPTANNTRQDVASFRLSKPFGNKDYVYGGFTFVSNRTGNTNVFGFHDAANTLNFSTNTNWSHRFSQRLYLQTGYNFSRSRTQNKPYFANRTNVEGGGLLINNVASPTIKGVDTDPNYWGPPGLSFSSGIAGLYDGNSSYNRTETNAANAEMNWNKSRHNIAVGGDFTRREFNYNTQSNPRGSFGFTGIATNGGVLTDGSALTDFLLGIPDTSNISYGNADKYLRQSVYDLYVRDDFRVNPQLSVNYGLRWEYGAPVTETKGRLVNLDPSGTNFSTVTQVVANKLQPGQNFPGSLVRPDRSGFAPNVGIAWRPIPGSSLLVRAGYQISNDTSVYQQTALLMATQAPLSNSLTLNQANCPITLINGFNPCSAITADSFGIDPNFRVGYAQIWTLSAQRDLPFSLQMIATYTGIKGTRGAQEVLPNTYPYNPADPAGKLTNPCPSCPVGFRYRSSNGNSTREGGTINLRRRLRSGFTANLSYTFSKSLDDDYAFGGNQNSTVSPETAQDWLHPERQRGLSTFDQRHVLSAQMTYTTGMGLGGKSLLSGWKGALYKEWSIQTAITAASGTPETPTYSVAVPGTSYSSVFRADYVPGQPIHASTPGVFINPKAFQAPAPGQYGNARRDSIPGPNQFSLNASMVRNFRMHDRYNLNAEIAANNVLNHVMYTNWYTSISPAAGGSSTLFNPNTLFGTPSNANPMRSITATVRLRF